MARPISRFEKAMRAVKRRPKVSLLVGALAISLIFVAVFATAYATIVGVKNREILARQQANQELLLQNILDARPESLELAIDNLKRADFDGLARLKEMEANRNLTVQQQANLTLTLALLGEIKVDAICNLVNELPATPWLCEIMVAALEPKSEEAHDALQRRIEDTGDPDKKSRWATVLMYLGEPNRSLEILSTTGKNGDRRYDWITSFPSWHGNWNATLEILKQTDHEDLRGALMTAVGLMRRRIIPNHNSIADTVRQIYQENENATTHSIAEWMLREWEAALPKLEADTHLPASRGWVLAPNGLTLIRIKSGEFLMGDTQQEQQATRNLHPVRITKSFYLSSTEVPRGVWEKIKQDKEFLAQYGMNAQQFDADIKTSPTQQHPAQALSWDAAVVFCNWLSENEDLEPCYSPTLENETANKDSSGDQSAGNRWVWNRDANGYRLPTEAEWEYACRAGSTSRYYFGSLDRRAYLFSHSSNRRPIPTLPTGSLIPNAFGLFDMHGNVWEWTWDWYDVFDEEPQTDPMGSENPVKEHGAVKVFRGGGVATMSGDSDSDARGYTATSSRFFNLGLRVARNAD